MSKSFWSIIFTNLSSKPWNVRGSVWQSVCVAPTPESGRDVQRAEGQGQYVISPQEAVQRQHGFIVSVSPF